MEHDNLAAWINFPEQFPNINDIFQPVYPPQLPVQQPPQPQPQPLPLPQPLQPPEPNPPPQLFHIHHNANPHYLHRKVLTGSDLKQLRFSTRRIRQISIHTILPMAQEMVAYRGQGLAVQVAVLMGGGELRGRIHSIFKSGPRGSSLLCRWYGNLRQDVKQALVNLVQLQGEVNLWYSRSAAGLLFVVAQA